VSYYERVGIQTDEDAAHHHQAHADASLCCRCGRPIGVAEPIWLVPAMLIWDCGGINMYKTVHAAACRDCGEELHRRVDATEAQTPAYNYPNRVWRNSVCRPCPMCQRHVHLMGAWLPWNHERSALCSNRCRNRVYGARFRERHPRPRKPGVIAQCQVCGRNFAPKRSDAKTCSNACRQKSYRKRTGVTDVEKESIVSS
jgi:hypothetical protein